MRAINYHKLNIFSDIQFGHDGNPSICSWKIARGGYNYWIVAREYMYQKNTSVIPDKTECEDVFYEKYIKTVPDDVLHCRTCSKAGNCRIERENKEDYCFGWTK